MNMINIEIPTGPSLSENEVKLAECYIDGKWRGVYPTFKKIYDEAIGSGFVLLSGISIGIYLTWKISFPDAFSDGFWGFVYFALLLYFFSTIGCLVAYPLYKYVLRDLVAFICYFFMVGEIKERVKNKLQRIELYQADLKKLDEKWPGIEKCSFDVKKYNEMKVMEFLNNIPMIMASSIDEYNKSSEIVEWEQCSDRDFEEKTAIWYRLMGYKVVLTPKSGDGGVDVVALRDGIKIYIQCKQYRDKIPVSVVRELFGVMSADNVRKGVIVCLRGGTEGAVNFAKENNIEIITAKDICGKMKCVSQNDVGHIIKNYDEYFCYEGFGKFMIISEPFSSVYDIQNYIRRKSPVFSGKSIRVVTRGNDKVYFVIAGNEKELYFPIKFVKCEIDSTTFELRWSGEKSLKKKRRRRYMRY